MNLGRANVFYSTRSRVLVGALVLLAFTIAISIIVDRAILLANLDERIDRDLVQEANEFQRLARGTDPDTGEPFGDNIDRVFDVFFERNVPGSDEVVFGLVDSRPYVISAAAPYPIDELDTLVAEWAKTTTSIYGTDDTPAGSLRWLALPVTGSDGQVSATLVVGKFLDEERNAVDEAVRTAVIAGFLAFVIAAAAAWVIAGRVLAPIRDLARGAAAVREEDLSHRIPVTGSGELADLTSAFNAMLDRVEESFSTQRAFLDDAGHELRTPVTIMRGHLEVASPGEPLGEATRELILDELDRMGRIVDDLLVLAKADQPDFVSPAPTDVADLTVEIVEKSKFLGDREWVVRPNAVAVVPLDRQRIIQAWMNLIRNAIQHTTDGDMIVVFSTTNDGWLELGVADSGAGVAPEDRTRIFERFGRGTSGSRARAEGAGLGLAIASTIAEAHGGAIALTDTPGGGATFTLRIPLNEQDHPNEDSETEE